MLTLLTLPFHFQIEVLFGIKQQETLHNSIQIHTTQNWKGTGTYIYSILTYPALRCNLDVLLEKISTLFNYISSLPMLLHVANTLAYTMLTLGCKSSYIHLRRLKHVELHCSINVFKLHIDGISVHS